MNQFILALSGIPASGKTRLANAIWDSLSDETPVEVVSTDAWRDEEYYSSFTPELENRVRAEALRKTKELVQNGLSVIHDDTNYYTSMRHELYQLAVQFGCVFGVVYVSTPLSKSKEWNDARETPIPIEVVERISERMDVPGSKYAWDRPIAVVDMNSDNLVDAAKEIVELLRNQEPPVIEAETEAELNAYNKLDSATRKVVSEFLREHPSYRLDPRVSSLRRELLKEARALGIKVHEAEQILKVRLGILAARVS